MQGAEYNFNHDSLEAELKTFAQKKITELYVHDQILASDKKKLIRFLNCAAKDIPDCYISLKIEPQIIDGEIISLVSNLFCSLESLEDFNYEIPEVPSRNITEREENGMKVYEIATDEEFDKWSARMKEVADDRTKSRREAFLWLADHCEELWQ